MGVLEAESLPEALGRGDARVPRAADAHSRVGRAGVEEGEHAIERQLRQRGHDVALEQAVEDRLQLEELVGRRALEQLREEDEAQVRGERAVTLANLSNDDRLVVLLLLLVLVAVLVARRPASGKSFLFDRRAGNQSGQSRESAG